MIKFHVRFLIVSSSNHYYDTAWTSAQSVSKAINNIKFRFRSKGLIRDISIIEEIKPETIFEQLSLF